MSRKTEQSVTPNLDSNLLRGLKYALPLSLLLWTIIMVAAVAYGETPIVGHDFLALQSPHFKYKKVLASIKAPSALGMLDFTFGYSLAPVRYMLASGKFKYLRVHLVNGSCLRLRNCGSYYPFQGFTPEQFEASVLRKDINTVDFLSFRTQEYCKIAEEFPDVKVLISPVLEHNLTPKGWRAAANIIKASCDKIDITNNPMTPKKIGDYWREIHGSIDKPAEIVSMDGFSYEDFSAAKIEKSKHVVVLVWDSHYNCRNPGPFIDPRERTDCATAKEVKYLDDRFNRR